MLNPKIADHHLMRKACIYIRQSTMAQVRFNQESTERQYNLADQAKSLGWTPEQIRILDGDLAQSGELTTKRDDFKTLVSDVAMGQVGAIFSLESSRLARSNKDWHRLLELCAVTKTLVFDGDGCYDPSDFNDSLVLGMKGTFAQAELHIIRARLHGAKLNRAQKGELRFPLPVGLVFDDDKIVLDPDQEVQGAVRAVFTLFEQENSAYAVVQRFHQIGLLFPRRSYGGVWDGKLIWGRLTHSRVIGVLANPSYAGTYVFGRYQSCTAPLARSVLNRARCHKISGALLFRTTIRVTSPGINSSPIADAWQRTGPTARFSLDLHGTDSVCCKACCFVAFAGGV